VIALESVFPDPKLVGEPAQGKISLKRTSYFPSRKAAYDNFKGKKMYAALDDRALRAYVVKTHTHKHRCVFELHPA